ncbi:amino acid deaminase [Rhodanobacter sp. DHB23]|uniref:amino acid deaminase n=1 Tax=Rhodanobacter sp. DHB23 TaxID=2775923 RepID=UPI00177F22F4|nr:amino acid deaminase [Rhodanobacter sp. DHB23]MBD8871392.1 amino acid deaminase [Rhodanobacter sp. DHB23]
MTLRMQPLEKGSPVTGKSLLEDVSLPAAAILEPALANNIAWMQRFADEHGARLAPHGKTTMTPALFRRQLDAGAWGITLATATQCATAFEHGVTRLLMANQLVGAPNMAIVADLIGRGADYCCLVDSVANVAALDRFFGERGLALQVLVELGVPGGRCGVRDESALATLVDAIAAAPAITLCGIEGYEGLIGGEHAADRVRAYAGRLVATLHRLMDSKAFADRKPIVTAAGSQWFDLIAEAFDRADLRERCTPVLRPGCYVVHDHRLYRDALAEVKARHPGLEGGLQPALAVFAHVQSLPEPGLAVVAMGKRDISCDPDLPIPLQRHRPGAPAQPLQDCVTRKVMDQHTMLAIPAGTDLRIGDIVSFGASHPCLTFDKWRQILCVDDELRVLEAMPTLF